MLFRRHVMLKLKHSTDVENNYGTLVINPNPLDQLHIEFNLVHKAAATPLQGEITIYNLNNDHEDIFRKRGVQIELFAGYINSRFGRIALCDVRRVDRNHLAAKTRTRTTSRFTKSGLNRLTRLHVGGQVEERATSFVDVSHKGVETVRDIIIQIVADGFPNMAVSNPEIIPSNLTEEDYLAGGIAGDVLTALLTKYGFNWYEDSGIIYITKDGEVAEELPTVIISEQTGMVGAPTVTDKGVVVSTLLDHRISLATKVRIETKTEEAAGDFKVISLRHRGNNRDGRFVTEIEAASPEVEEAQETDLVIGPDSPEFAERVVPELPAPDRQSPFVPINR